uniref:Mitochondrial carrier protein n=1 Tax=Arcella intermedia TaxID=1963864 RepID=A0A6B2LC41_9EUKA
MKDTIAGGAGGACLVIVGHPLDTIKVRFQTMQIIPGQPPPYSGVIDCATKMITKEGVLGLYKGMLAPLLGVTPMYSLCFFGYSIGKNIFTTPETYRRQSPNDLLMIGLAGATSGLFTTPILAPLERLKCILQIQNMHAPRPGEVRFKGPMDLGRHILKEGGVRALNRGYIATNIRDSLGSVAYFSVYEVLKRQFKDYGSLGILCAGGFAGMANWVPAIPFDTLKSRLQTAPEGKYNGIRDVAAEIFAKEGTAKGFQTLYRGVVPVMVRAFPANAACFFGYETVRRWLN